MDLVPRSSDLVLLTCVECVVKKTSLVFMLNFVLYICELGPEQSMVTV